MSQWFFPSNSTRVQVPLRNHRVYTPELVLDLGLISATKRGYLERGSHRPMNGHGKHRLVQLLSIGFPGRFSLRLLQESRPNQSKTTRFCYTHLAVGQNQWYHFVVGAPPILVYFSGDWDVHWGYDLAFALWPLGPAFYAEVYASGDGTKTLRVSALRSMIWPGGAPKLREPRTSDLRAGVETRGVRLTTPLEFHLR